jgi:GH18 family chitinase
MEGCLQGFGIVFAFGYNQSLTGSALSRSGSKNTLFYGRSFDCGGLYQRFQKSQYFRYKDVLKFLQLGWESIWDDCAKVPYLRNPEKTEIICYDDERSIFLKYKFVKEKQAAGIIIWELSQDYDQKTAVLLDVVGKEFK